LAEATERVTSLHREAGYLNVRVTTTPLNTDDPRRVVVRVVVEPGELVRVRERHVLISPVRYHPELAPVLDRLEIRVGMRQDKARLTRAIEQLTENLVQAGFYEAKASYRIRSPGVVDVLVEPGVLFRVRIEGNVTFDDEELADELDLDKLREPKPDLLEPLLRKFYVQHGFLDARVRFLRIDSPGGLESELYGWVREGPRFRVAERLFPCLGQSRTPSDLDDEVDGVLSEQFPEVTLVEPPASASLDAAMTGRDDSRAPAPLQAQPWQSYSDAAYQAARAHLEDLYRSEGYLDAEVGPITLSRRRCARDSPPGQCWVEGPRPLPVVDCANAAPGESRTEIVQTCVPDPAHGVSCEEEGVVVIPVHPGRHRALAGSTRQAHRHRGGPANHPRSLRGGRLRLCPNRQRDRALARPHTSTVAPEHHRA
jgi:hypothetical protein